MHRWISSTLALAMLCTTATAFADPQVTAEWNIEVPGSSFGSFGGAGGLSEGRGQTFEATVDGRVVTIELRIARSSEHDTPIIIALHDVDQSGEPTGPALMSAEFAADDMPVNVIAEPTVFAFDSGATVMAGQSYAITCIPATPDPGGNNYFLNGSSSDGATYEQGHSLRTSDGGATWVASTISDWGFRVVVDDATAVEAATWSSIKDLFR